MTVKELIALLEKGFGEEINEDHEVLTLIDSRIKKHLEAVDAKDVVVDGGDHPDAVETKKATFSQYLGDMVRVAKGQQPRWTEKKAFVEVKDLPAAGTQTDPAGGYLVPDERSKELINLVEGESVMRGLCRTVPMKGMILKIPTVTGGVVAYWIPYTDAMRGDLPDDAHQADGEAITSRPTFGEVTLQSHRLAVMVPVTEELLDDSDADVDKLLYELIYESLAEGIDVALLQGAGTELDPITGLFNRITTNVESTGPDFSPDDVLDSIFTIYVNSLRAKQVDVIGHALAQKNMYKWKDTDDRYIYRQPTDPNIKPTIWAEPFTRCNNIPINLGDSADKTRLLFGDFKHALFGLRKEVIVDVNPFGDRAFFGFKTLFRASMRVGFNVSQESRFAVLNGVPAT